MYKDMDLGRGREGGKRERKDFRGHELCVALTAEQCLGKSSVGPKLRGIGPRS